MAFDCVRVLPGRLTFFWHVSDISDMTRHDSTRQVASDFELTAPSLKTTCIYGGAPYRPQVCCTSYSIMLALTSGLFPHTW